MTPPNTPMTRDQTLALLEEAMTDRHFADCAEAILTALEAHGHPPQPCLAKLVEERGLDLADTWVVRSSGRIATTALVSWTDEECGECGEKKKHNVTAPTLTEALAECDRMRGEGK